MARGGQPRSQEEPSALHSAPPALPTHVVLAGDKPLFEAQEGDVADEAVRHGWLVVSLRPPRAPGLGLKCSGKRKSLLSQSGEQEGRAQLLLSVSGDPELQPCGLEQ